MSRVRSRDDSSHAGPYGVPKEYVALYSSATSQTAFQSTYPFPSEWFSQGDNKVRHLSLESTQRY